MMKLKIWFNQDKNEYNIEKEYDIVLKKIYLFCIIRDILRWK